MLLASCTHQSVPPSRPDALHLPYTQLLFAGDVMFSRAVRRAILEHDDPAFPLRPLGSMLAAADLAFVNLESPFSDRGPYFDEGLIFHAAPNAVAALQLAGIDVASTANNHARDCGPHGVEFTVSWLRAHGIQPVGSSESRERSHAGVVLVRNGLRFGFLGYTFDQNNGNWRDMDERIPLLDAKTVAQDVARLRTQTDFIVVSMHAGTEYVRKPNALQVECAHRAIDAGARLVIGHHPHVIQTHEHYRQADIYYSLGNFVFDQYQRVETQHGEIIEVDLVGKNILVQQALRVRITPAGPVLE